VAPSTASWDAYRVGVGRRLLAMNPGQVYDGPVPEPLLAIPVLEIELNRDGSVRSIRVDRRPSQAPDTVQLAIDAVRRAAPFGDVSRLPQPWRFRETFLFRDDRRFKPRSLD
jgi:protein TonB